MAGEDDRLVKIAVAGSEVEAQILQDALAQEGIPSHVKPLNRLELITGPALSSFEIFVFARDEKRARWVIGE